MKIAEEIIAYLEAELSEAAEKHQQARESNAQEALFYLIRENTIKSLLEEIKEGSNEQGKTGA